MFSSLAFSDMVGTTMYRCDNQAVKIIEIIDDFKGIVKIEFIQNQIKHGIPIEKKIILNENVVFLSKEPRTENSSSSNKPAWINTIQGWKNPLSFNLHSFFNDYLNGLVKINPEYQRDFVWYPKQQREYLQAILDCKIEPTIYSCLEIQSEHDDVYEIIDGKQRLTTLFNFLINRISLPDGKYFSDLSTSDATFFRNLNLNVYRLHTPNFNRSLTNQEKWEIFSMLNAKGTKLTEDELKYAQQILLK